MSNRPATASEPFRLVAEVERDEPTQEQKIDSMYAYLPAIHRDVALAREEAIYAREAAISAREMATKANDGVVELRTLVIGDHAPRVTSVEVKANEAVAKANEAVAKTSAINLPTWAVKGGKYGALVSLIPILEALWPLVKQALKIP